MTDFGNLRLLSTSEDDKERRIDRWIGAAMAGAVPDRHDEEAAKHGDQLHVGLRSNSQEFFG